MCFKIYDYDYVFILDCFVLGLLGLCNPQGCSEWVSRGIRDRYFFVGIIHARRDIEARVGTDWPDILKSGRDRWS